MTDKPKTQSTKPKTKTKRLIKGKSRREEAAEFIMQNITLPQKVILQIADEVGKAVTQRITVRRTKNRKTNTKIENPVFLDTSAIIDMRVFDLAKIGALYGNFIVLEGVLTELKNIADSKDVLKRERGRRAMDALDKFKKIRGMKVKIIPDEFNKGVDESIIDHAKKYKGRIITCDYNLSKKAKISNVVAVDLYEMTNVLKTQALPGEEFFVKIVQVGKGLNQGVGYLPDGTMLVVEHGKPLVGKTVEVRVSRIIQTDAGKILFSKLKSSDQ
jgi:uncharacterized protein YacL